MDQIISTILTVFYHPFRPFETTHQVESARVKTRAVAGSKPAVPISTRDARDLSTEDSDFRPEDSVDLHAKPLPGAVINHSDHAFHPNYPGLIIHLTQIQWSEARVSGSSSWPWSGYLFALLGLVPLGIEGASAEPAGYSFYEAAVRRAVKAIEAPQLAGRATDRQGPPEQFLPVRSEPERFYPPILNRFLSPGYSLP